jgi:hypothetical protein
VKYVSDVDKILVNLKYWSVSKKKLSFNLFHFFCYVSGAFLVFNVLCYLSNLVIKEIIHDF